MYVADGLAVYHVPRCGFNLYDLYIHTAEKVWIHKSPDDGLAVYQVTKRDGVRPASLC